MERGRILRHIQLKVGVKEKPGTLSVSTHLAAKPSGCVIWIKIDSEMKIVRFAWLGGTPAEPLPALGEIKAKRSGKREGGRQEHRKVVGHRFDRGDTYTALLDKLFGSDGPHAIPHDLTV